MRICQWLGCLLLWCALAGLAVTAQAVTDPAADLVLLLAFDGNTHDSSGSEIHGETSKGPVFVSGQIGAGALQAQVVDDYVDLGQANELDFGRDTDFTVSIWIRTDGSEGDPSIVSNKSWNNGQKPGWGLFVAGGGRKWKMNIADGMTRKDIECGEIADGEWHLLSATFDRTGEAKIYQDGTAIGKIDISAVGSVDSGLPTVVAQDGTKEYPSKLTAEIDDVAIWRRALTANEIDDIYVAGLDSKSVSSPKARRATSPYPSQHAVDIAVHHALRWRGGLHGEKHDVYMGSDAKEVADAERGSSAFRGTVESARYLPEPMETSTRYFWRIDTLEADGTVTKGNVWDFITKRRPIGRWVFDAQNLQGDTVRDSAGDAHGKIAGPMNLLVDPASLIFDGRKTAVEAPGLGGERLPVCDLTVMAWVYITGRSEGTAIAGCLQGLGESQRGWQLGLDREGFHFQLATGGESVTLRSETTYITERWYQVTATSDGKRARLYVDGIEEADSDSLPGPIEYGSTPLTIGAARHGGQSVYFAGRLHEVRLYDRAIGKDEVVLSRDAKKSLFPSATESVFGPYLRFTAPDTAVIRWKTEKPSATILEYGEGDFLKHRIEEAELTTNHEVTLTGLKAKVLYHYIVKVESGQQVAYTPVYECDNFFNYTLPPVPELPSPYAENSDSQAVAALAEKVLSDAGIHRGYCLVLGIGDGQLVYELSRQSDLHVIGVDTDGESIQTARKKLKQAGLYGLRATVRQVNGYNALPFTQYFSNLIVINNKSFGGDENAAAEEVKRVLRPEGGVLYQCDRDRNIAAKETRGVLPGRGVWSHQYGSPDNSADSRDNLQGATGTGDLEVQWIGRPGPRAMVDRNPRKPSPLSINGRLYTQGLHRIIAQDAYNGTILWSQENPNFERFNIPRDCSNWCADAENVYTAVRSQRWRLNAQTGDLEFVYDVMPPTGSEKEYTWGYIARSEDKLYASAVLKGSHYLNFRGGSTTGWADATSGPITSKICSDSIYAINPSDGAKVWEYTEGKIINPTITIGDGKMFFVECRNEKVKETDTGRIGLPELWLDQYLVSLDQHTGDVLWEQPIDTVDGVIVFYLQYTNGTLILTSSKTGYNMYAFDAETGESGWHIEHDWIKDNHGQHMQHPAVVGGTVYLRPKGYSIADGSLLTSNMPPHEGGCATFVGTGGALLYRGKGGSISMWDVGEEVVSDWYSIRPGCWLSTIAAGGMVLSPEGGGGCSCGGWLETSVAFSRAFQ